MSTHEFPDRDGWAYFKIDSSLPLSAIAGHMGMDGEERSWSLGDVRFPVGNTRVRRTFSRWHLQSGVARGRPLDEHLRALWRRMSPLRSAIISLPDDMRRTVQCVAHFASHEDRFALASGHLATLAYYRANIDCDFYFEDGFGREEEGRPYWEWPARAG